MPQIERVYLGHDNRIDLALLSEGVVPELTPVSRMQLELTEDLVIDSQTSPDAFDWSATLTQAEASRVPGAAAGNSKLILALGNESIPVGTYHAQLIVFDPSNPDGIVWGRINIVVE